MKTGHMTKIIWGITWHNIIEAHDKTCNYNYLLRKIVKVTKTNKHDYNRLILCRAYRRSIKTRVILFIDSTDYVGLVYIMY